MQPPPSVVLRSNLPRMQVFHLPELGYEPTTVVARTRDPRSGVSGAREHERRLPRSITLCAKGTEGCDSPPLPAFVRQNPEVAAAIGRGHLLVVETPTPGPTVESTNPAEAGEE